MIRGPYGPYWSNRYNNGVSALRARKGKLGIGALLGRDSNEGRQW